MAKDDKPGSMADVTAIMRDLKRELEKVFTANIDTFEKATGTTVEDIEIHRTLNADMSSDPDVPKTRLTGVTFKVRI